MTQVGQELVVGSAMGLSQRKIAFARGRSHQTIKNEMGTLRTEFGVKKSMQVVLLAIKRGLVDTDQMVNGYEFSRFDKLTPRESELLVTARKVYESDDEETLKERNEKAIYANIAERLIISEETVKNHVGHVNFKLGVGKLTRAVVLDAIRERREMASV